jgi:hypothetical protein
MVQIRCFLMIIIYYYYSQNWIKVESERFITKARERWWALGIRFPPKGHTAEYEQILQSRVAKGVVDFMED